MDQGDRSSSRRSSEASSVTLLELEPEPIDTPASEVYEHDFEEVIEEDVDGSTSTLKPGSTGNLGLSGSAGGNGTPTGPGAIFYLMRIQKFSSYAMGLFTSLHLVNVSLIPAITRSVPGSETYLLMTREIYQGSLTEPILVALPVVAHIGSGILLRFLRRRQNVRRYGTATPGMYAVMRSRTDTSTGVTSTGPFSAWPPLSYISMSGYAFAAFYAAHVFMNRILPLQVEGDSSNIGLAYVAHGFARHPITASVAYVGLLAAGCSHMIWGQARWFGIAPSTKGWLGREGAAVDKKTRRRRRRRWLSLHGAAVGVMALWAVGGLGVVARGGLTDGWIGKVYDNLFEAVGL